MIKNQPICQLEFVSTCGSLGHVAFDLAREQAAISGSNPRSAVQNGTLAQRCSLSDRRWIEKWVGSHAYLSNTADPWPHQVGKDKTGLDWVRSNFSPIPFPPGTAMDTLDGMSRPSQYRQKPSLASPANTGHWATVGSMLGQRRIRWIKIEPTMAQCISVLADEGGSARLF